MVKIDNIYILIKKFIVLMPDLKQEIAVIEIYYLNIIMVLIKIFLLFQI
jgi:hypothetical protein